MIRIQTKTGNLLKVTAGHIVHGCNAQGVMGSGVALGVKQTWPNVFNDYEQQYETYGLVLGKAYPSHATPDLMVWNAITQNLYGGGKRLTSYDAVCTCFEQVNKFLSSDHTGVTIPVTEIHIPLIGATRGGGNWEIIREIIEQTMDYPVTLWLPDSTVTTL